ncbi:MAG TPA: DNA ligase D, partial [Gemmatimonadaceae bacterium]|nr:DNA ligase D [Gemmatimonadaceae bacterium]
MISYRPQKALLVDRPPPGNRWIHELKLDGFRMGVFVERGKIRIISRRGTDYTLEFPEIVASARRIKAKDALLDGEIVVLDKQGISRFQLLQQLGSSRAGLAYYAFDLLWLNGENLVKQPLEDRKRALKKLVGRDVGVIRYTDHLEGAGADVFEQACALGAEGIISKLRDTPYRLDARSSDWQKIKCIKRQEFVVGGFTDPSGSRVGVGSILVGYYERNSLRFAGKVGTGAGWSNAFSLKLRRDLEQIEIERTPFDPPPPGWLGRNAHWVKPQKVAEVEFTEWTGDGHIRHPSLQGFRADKAPRDVRREREAHLVTPESPLVYPQIKVRTSNLVKLYSEIADWVLPHIEQRPLTLVKMTAPITREDALRTQAKFIHHTARDQRFVPDKVPRVRIKEKKKIGEYCYIDSRAALLALIDAGVIELHAWNAKIENVERPDRIVFDIDPGDAVSWRDVVGAARRLREILQERGLESWVKTTGGKGLHVVVPFRAEHDWDAVFEFSRTIAAQMTAESPRYTLSFDKAARRGKILIDYKRNYRTSIAVAAFSTRAVPSGAMSIPVAWDELARLKGSDAWTVQTIRDRLHRLKED